MPWDGGRAQAAPGSKGGKRQSLQGGEAEMGRGKGCGELELWGASGREDGKAAGGKSGERTEGKEAT